MTKTKKTDFDELPGIQIQIEELKTKTQNLEKQLKNVEDTTEDISKTLDKLKECAKVSFPEAYQKYLEEHGEDE